MTSMGNIEITMTDDARSVLDRFSKAVDTLAAETRSITQTLEESIAAVAENVEDNDDMIDVSIPIGADASRLLDALQGVKGTKQPTFPSDAEDGDIWLVQFAHHTHERKWFGMLVANDRNFVVRDSVFDDHYAAPTGEIVRALLMYRQNESVVEHGRRAAADDVVQHLNSQTENEQAWDIAQARNESIRLRNVLAETQREHEKTSMAHAHSLDKIAEADAAREAMTVKHANVVDELAEARQSLEVLHKQYSAQAAETDRLARIILKARHDLERCTILTNDGNTALTSGVAEVRRTLASIDKR